VAKRAATDSPAGFNNAAKRVGSNLEKKRNTGEQGAAILQNGENPFREMETANLQNGSLSWVFGHFLFRRMGHAPIHRTGVSHFGNWVGTHTTKEQSLFQGERRPIWELDQARSPERRVGHTGVRCGAAGEITAEQQTQRGARINLISIWIAVSNALLLSLGFAATLRHVPQGTLFLLGSWTKSIPQ
jgi:hypothetical protein